MLLALTFVPTVCFLLFNGNRVVNLMMSILVAFQLILLQSLLLNKGLQSVFLVIFMQVWMILIIMLIRLVIFPHILAKLNKLFVYYQYNFVVGRRREDFMLLMHEIQKSTKKLRNRNRTSGRAYKKAMEVQYQFVEWLELDKEGKVTFKNAYQVRRLGFYYLYFLDKYLKKPIHDIRQSDKDDFIKRLEFVSWDLHRYLSKADSGN